MGMAARLGDLTAHGGSILIGCPTVIIGGSPAARIGDLHVCPLFTPVIPPIPHVGGPIILGDLTVLIGGMPAARVGDLLTCVGPPDTIALGCPTVFIGESGSGSTSGGETVSGSGSLGSSSAAQSAMTALIDNIESSTKEKNWLEFEFVDNAGNPISGSRYKLNDPNNNDSFGALEATAKSEEMLYRKEKERLH